MSDPIYVYTDGACSGNPGPGGYGAIVKIHDGTMREFSGAENNSTSNRMEIKAAVVGLTHAAEHFPAATGAGVILVTDSKYLANSLSKGWLKNWRENGWLLQSGQPVKNQDLWQELIAGMEKLRAAGARISVRWVKGHASNQLNNRCDLLATSAIRQLKQGKASSITECGETRSLSCYLGQEKFF